MCLKEEMQCGMFQLKSGEKSGCKRIFVKVKNVKFFDIVFKRLRVKVQQASNLPNHVPQTHAVNL